MVLVRRGFAQPLTIPPNVESRRRFRAAARRGGAGRGLWAPARLRVGSPRAATRASARTACGSPARSSGRGPRSSWSTAPAPRAGASTCVRPLLEAASPSGRRPPRARRLGRRRRLRAASASSTTWRQRCATRDAALLFGHSYGALVAAGAAAGSTGCRGSRSTSRRWAACWPTRRGSRRFEAGWRPVDRAAACARFLRDVGGYSDAEIDAMEGTPAWGRRARRVADGAARAERRGDARARAWSGGLDLPCLLLLARRARTGRAARPRLRRRASRRRAYVQLAATGHGAHGERPRAARGELERFLSAGPLAA